MFDWHRLRARHRQRCICGQAVDDGGVERILGIVGGTGPESTIDYYRRLVAGWRARTLDGSYPRVIIDSVEAGRVIRWLADGEYGLVAEAIGDAIRALAAADAKLVIIASNAVHLAYEPIALRASVPILHIVDAARDAAVRVGYRRLALFGTRFVMESSLYPTRFGPGFEIVPPDAGERDVIHRIYMDELLAGLIRDESRERLLAIVSAMREREGIDAVLLGGTELALILGSSNTLPVPILDTAGIHVEAALDWMLEPHHDGSAEPRDTAPQQ